MRETFKIEGLRELDEALKELPKATGRNVLKRTLVKGAEPIERAAEAGAPRAEGDLAASIEIGTKLSPRQKRMHKKASPVEVHVGAGPLPQAHLSEFGSVHNTPTPYLRPAWDANQMAALESIKGTLGQEITKAAERLARKAARLR